MDIRWFLAGIVKNCINYILHTFCWHDAHFFSCTAGSTLSLKSIQEIDRGGKLRSSTCIIVFEDE